MTALTSAYRASGLVLGLAAGDRNGGPQRMGLRVAEEALRVATASNTEESFRQGVAARYFSWNIGGDNEPDQAFDTGMVFTSVFGRVSAAAARNPATLVEVVDEAARRAFAQRQSAGVNPAHRNVILAAALPPTVGLDILANLSRAETKLTHLHDQAVDTAVATAIIARVLIANNAASSEPPSVQLLPGVLAAFEAVSEPMVKEVLKTFIDAGAVNTVPRSSNHTGGHSPLVLSAALGFLWSARSFEDALMSSIAFAGPENYCPVLVGALGGALFGVYPSSMTLKHALCEGSQREWVDDVAAQVAQVWQ